MTCASDFKRIRIVLPDGKLPDYVPPQTIHQKLSRREWTITVDGYTEELLAETRAENNAVSADVFDMNLEEIFKDVVRGQQLQSQEESHALGTH